MPILSLIRCLKATTDSSGLMSRNVNVPIRSHRTNICIPLNVFAFFEAGSELIVHEEAAANCGRWVAGVVRGALEGGRRMEDGGEGGGKRR